MYAAPNRTPQLAPVSVVLIADPSAFKHPAVMVPILSGTTTLTTLAARKQGLDLRMAASDAHARRVIFEPHESLESWKQIAKDLQLARHLGSQAPLLRVARQLIPRLEPPLKRGTRIYVAVGQQRLTLKTRRRHVEYDVFEVRGKRLEPANAQAAIEVKQMMLGLPIPPSSQH